MLLKTASEIIIAFVYNMMFINYSYAKSDRLASLLLSQIAFMSFTEASMLYRNMLAQALSTRRYFYIGQFEAKLKSKGVSG